MPSIIEVDTIKNKTGTQNTVLSTDGSGNNTISVANIKANDGTAGLVIADSTGEVTGTLGSATVFPAGTILQVIEAEDNTHTTKSIGLHDIVTTPTITTKKANSKFVIFGHTGAGYPNSGTSNFIMFFKKTTGGSDTDIGYFTDGRRQGGVSDGQITSNLEHPTCISGMYQDSPSLAKGSTLTYTLRMGVRDGGIVLHRVGSSTDADWASRWHSRIFVWELAV